MTIEQQIQLDEVKRGGSLFKYTITIFDMERSTRTAITIK
jgi:hypothetical protein